MRITTCVAATSGGVTAFERHACARPDRRRAIWRAVVVGLGTAAAAAITAGAVTVTAASIIAVALSAAAHLKATPPTALKTFVFANPGSRLGAGAAKFSGLIRVLTHTVRAADVTLHAKLASAAILTSALRRTAEIAPAAPALPRVADADPSTTASISSMVLQKRISAQQPRNGSMLLADADSRTAIYDIEAHTVYLPNGLKLEAHSGLGQRLDDPRHVDEKNRGATPPNVYDLVLREEPFHGVQAIRLNPVDDGRMFGRDGILAHTYMLGSTGQSFGCVSFKNYTEFLKAFLRGEIDRLVVVPHLEAKTANGDRMRQRDRTVRLQ